MTAPAHASALPQVRRVTVDAGGMSLSGLLAEPEHGLARAAVVALHGGGMHAGYFNTRTRPGLSLLELGPTLGFTVLALDRPGYGLSAAHAPQGRRVADQAVAVRTALRDLSARWATGAGTLLLAHSFGGKVALAAAADSDEESLLGLDLSGIGHAYQTDQGDVPESVRRGGWRRNWGPLRLYPPDTFRPGGAPVETMPPREEEEAARWPGYFHALAPRVRVPVRLTFAEHEAWWRHDPDALAELTAAFTAAPRFTVEHQPESGHNISLGWTARSYHLRALAFLEECLAVRETEQSQRGGSSKVAE
ncbi:alpha/beta hydrolase [Streptomyces mayonensis]|uniref:alpha/beta hydrolase n=1 Tax=Streptomyces mayonensis TaxID=2750816 RepID=UPI001C1DF4DE|nr:alpha/beta hydrolase [Streptomyces sp. A108]MBU6536426.1 alpha/beta fold hydrolase [Streptomyces sp. A108]